MITLDNLCRNYRFKEKAPGLKGAVRSLIKPEWTTKRAVADFSCTLDQGDFVGLIGPNGAGKTTLIKMMTGIIPPSSGRIEVCGFRPADLKDEFRRSYAVVMGQKSQLWWDLPASDSFELNREIYRIPADRFKRNVDELTELFEVGDLLGKPIRQLSLGQRMKMEITASLLHDPRVIFLDEPTIGLDGTAQKQIRLFLKRINKERNTTILLTSHYMEDIRSLCERVMVINEGRKVYEGTYRELTDRVSPWRIVRLSFEAPSTREDLMLPGTEILEWEPYRAALKVAQDRVKETVAALFADFELDDLSIEEEDITDVVEKIYRRDENLL
ncbi:MAG: ATP-binding cassette domain-containing protein [Spirochaetales bacterium]|nr:ATP-binding cassette domain-containing protein [Spirochaetales bacterium]